MSIFENLRILEILLIHISYFSWMITFSFENEQYIIYIFLSLPNAKSMFIMHIFTFLFLDGVILLVTSYRQKFLVDKTSWFIVSSTYLFLETCFKFRINLLCQRFLTFWMIEWGMITSDWIKMLTFLKLVNDKISCDILSRRCQNYLIMLTRLLKI